MTLEHNHGPDGAGVVSQMMTGSQSNGSQARFWPSIGLPVCLAAQGTSAILEKLNQAARRAEAGHQPTKQEAGQACPMQATQRDQPLDRFVAFFGPRMRSGGCFEGLLDSVKEGSAS